MHFASFFLFEGVVCLLSVFHQSEEPAVVYSILTGTYRKILLLFSASSLDINDSNENYTKVLRDTNKNVYQL